jgi:hypothetical protein
MNRLIQFKSSRWAAILLATVVAIITSVVVANATQTITTPNAVKFTYNLAPGANGAAITPATNTSVLVMGCCTTSADRGVGQVSLLHIPSNVMHWVGLESCCFLPKTITSGDSGTAGTHIVYIDYNDAVDIEVASADTIRVHNGNPYTVAANVTLIW